MKTKLNTKQKIIESAAVLFLLHGFSNVSMDVIAEAAAVTKVTVYQHFKSKEYLFLSCLCWRLENRETYLDAHFVGKSGSATQVLEVFDWMAEKTSRGNFQGCAFLKAANEMASTLPEVRVVAMQAKLLLRRRIVGMLCDAGAPSAELLGDTLALLLEGAQALSLIEQSQRPFITAKLVARSVLESYLGNPRALCVFTRVGN